MGRFPRMWCKRSAAVALTVFLASCFAGTPAHATGTPEQNCQAARWKAAGKYTKCQTAAQARRELTADFSIFQLQTSKCREKYRLTWAKLQVKYPATTCAGPRFVDNGATVTDNLTALEWEKKTNLDSTPNATDPHDADNRYTWCADGDANFLCDNGVNSGPADGTCFTRFLASLDSAGGCFTGQCDWRLPTREEQETLLAARFPCNASPCVDPLFGPTQTNDGYWSSNTYLYQPDNAWFVDLSQGVVGLSTKANSIYARGVRGGL